MMLLPKRQLYSLTENTFQAPDYVDLNGKLLLRPANDIPLLIWPDGSWCSPANSFMRNLFEARLSRFNKGGTLAVAAASVTHLIRFCWERGIDLHEVTDNQFREFVGKLLSEKRIDHPEQKARNENRVIDIGRTCLQLFDFLARSMEDVGLIGPNGRIQAQQKTHTVKIGKSGRSRSTRVVQYWDHPALPQPDTKRKRLPILTADIEKIRNAVHVVCKSSYGRMLRHTILKLLEITGARRGEIAGITIDSVIKANRMDIPMLSVPTLKKRGDRSRHRLLPISRTDLAFLIQYIEIHRRSIVRRKLVGKDHGLLLVSATTGKPFKPNSISQLVRILAKAAGIPGKACPHMFRHRFITKLFVALIEQHAIENKDEFRRLLLNGETFKRKVAEWTDHSSLESLERYIDLAFDELSNFKKTYDIIRAGMAIDSFLASLQSVILEVKSGGETLFAANRLLDLAQGLKIDLVKDETTAEAAV